MLHDFIAAHRDDLVARTTTRLHTSRWPPAASRKMNHGVPVFLDHLVATLRLEPAARPLETDVFGIGATAARHGAELLGAGFNVSQVVHEYGDVSQAITELAAERGAPITVPEFHVFSRCLDGAIADAVTEHARLTAQQRTADEMERFGQAAHELRDHLNGAVLAFQALKAGAPIANSAGAVLGRSLANLESLIERMLSDVRLAADQQHCEPLSVGTLLSEIGAVGALRADARQICFSVLPVDPALTVVADPRLLRSAVMNLVNNAFKYTPAGGAVSVSAEAREGRLLLEVRDQCGGLRGDRHDMFKVFGERRGNDRSGLGLGLSMARQAVRAHGGDVRVRNVPGQGCVFAIDVPLGSPTLRPACAPA